MSEPCMCGDPECKRCCPFRRNADEWNDPDPDADYDEQRQEEADDAEAPQEGS